MIRGNARRVVAGSVSNEVRGRQTVTMAQPSSMQREPTMEEILASIRRIIEDGDQGISKPAATNVEPAAPVHDAAPQARVQEPVAPRVEAADETVDDVEAFRRDVELEEIVAETPRAAQQEAPRAAAVDMPRHQDPSAIMAALTRMNSPCVNPSARS